MQSPQLLSHNSKSSDYGKALLLVARAPRWRSVFLTFLFFTIACWTWRTTSHSDLTTWAKSTQEDKTPKPFRPAVLKPSNLTLDLESGNHTTVPAQLKKENPQFHLLIHAPEINAGVCRCLLSSYILDYPPPTLVGYQSPGDLSSMNLKPDNHKAQRGNSKDQNGIPDVTAYLGNQHRNRIRDEDAVLVVDGETTLFQLPSEVLLSTFATELRHRDQHLASQYPHLTLQTPLGAQRVQRFNESILFASTISNTTTSTPAQRSYFGDTRPGTTHTTTTPTLNDAAILGSGKSIRRLFYAAAKANNQVVRPDTSTFRTLHAQQATTRTAVFDPPLRHRSVWGMWKRWLSARFRVERAVRAEDEHEARVAALRDLGIGVDEGSRVMYSIPEGGGGVERWIGRVASAEEAGVGVPEVLRETGVRGPFGLHPGHLHVHSLSTAITSFPRDEKAGIETVKEETLPLEKRWDQVPLVLDPETGSVPSLISGASEDVWERLWFRPYARTLLDQYLLRSRSKELASEAAVGGERWWDRRGGRGGVWTTEGEWLDAGDLCGGFGGDLFVDGEKFWGERGRGPVTEPKVRYVVVPGPVSLDPGGDGKGQAEGSEEATKQAESSAEGQSSAGPGGESPKTPGQGDDIPVAIMPDGTKKALSDWGNGVPESAGQNGEDEILRDTHV